MLNFIVDVAEFHSLFGAPMASKPGLIPADRVTLRDALHWEEFNNELRPAMYRGDLPEIADAIADSIYVLIGTALEYGIPLAEVWRRVHASNMAKAGGKVRPDGKIMKPEGWRAPDVTGALRDAGWEG